MELALFSLAMCFGLLSARAEAIVDKSNIQATNTAIKIINFGSMVSTFSMIAWGFINLDWWVPIYTFILFYLAASLLINRNMLKLFIYVLPVIGIVTISVSAYLWLFVGKFSL